MVISQGEIWWTDLGDPNGSEPGYRRPVVVVQSDSFNHGGISTVICVSLTSNLRLANAPGNVLLPAAQTGLPRDSVANVSQMVTLEMRALSDCTGQISVKQLKRVLAGIEELLGQ